MVRLFRPIPAHVQLLLSSKILSHRLERYEGAVFFTIACLEIVALQASGREIWAFR